MVSCVRFGNNWFLCEFYTVETIFWWLILLSFDFSGLRKEDLEMHIEKFA